MPDAKDHTSISERLTAEDIVIIVAIVLTLLMTPLLTALWFLEKPILIPPPVISVFLGIAVSALLYRFLGGIDKASFTLGALKVTGSAAILIGLSWWLNGELEKYLPQPSPAYPKFNLSSDVNPNAESWYAVDTDTGRPVHLEFKSHQQAHPAPSEAQLNALRKSRHLSLTEQKGSLLVVSKDSQRIVGQLANEEISKLGYHNGVDIKLKPYRVESFGATQEIDFSVHLPFTVSTNGFSENYTRFSIKSKLDGRTLLEDAILLRGAKIFKHSDKYYLISVIQLNHAPEDVEPYAKFYIAEISIDYV
ncbi:hypothetical protein [Agaribacterium haliotis]|uniref:hypothetical protein n=1 Tax=Agaribacterium haliotis TaxID=2013869 RepID=UPI000BB5704D|nr:hypothetical protein [Agaribacterium haliotis]